MINNTTHIIMPELRPVTKNEFDALQKDINDFVKNVYLEFGFGISILTKKEILLFANKFEIIDQRYQKSVDSLLKQSEPSEYDLYGWRFTDIFNNGLEMLSSYVYSVPKNLEDAIDNKSENAKEAEIARNAKNEPPSMYDILYGHMRDPNMPYSPDRGYSFILFPAYTIRADIK